MKSSLISFATEEVPELREHHLPMSHLLYGVIALLVFLALLGLLWSFRNTAARFGQNDKSGH